MPPGKSSSIIAFLDFQQHLHIEFLNSENLADRTLLNTLSANPSKWSNTLKQFVGKLSVFDHFVGLALKGLSKALSTECC